MPYHLPYASCIVRALCMLKGKKKKSRGDDWAIHVSNHVILMWLPRDSHCR